MKTFLYFNILFLSCYSIVAQPKENNGGVYFTQEDFDKNILHFATPYHWKEKFGFLNSDFEYEARGKVLLRQPNKSFLSFEPGTIYGFLNKGKKYLYVAELKKYLFVLNEAPVSILIAEDLTFFPFNTHEDLKLFYLNNQNKLKEMNNLNINSDYYNDRNKQLALNNILSKFQEITKKRRLNVSEISRYAKECFLSSSS